MEGLAAASETIEIAVSLVTGIPLFFGVLLLRVTAQVIRDGLD